MIISYIQKTIKKHKSKNDPDAKVEDPPCPVHGVCGPCSECKAATRAARIYRARLIIGLFLPFALQSLDTTLVATALAPIAQDFSKVSELNWIVSAFNLTSAAFIPFWGQMADVFGRHAAVQACTWIVIIGSAICTGAPTSSTGGFPLFLIGRGLQGMGCAGVNVVCRIIIADKVSLQENTKNMGIFSMFAGIAFGVGPVIGGHLTSADWRWCFAINIPVGVVGVIFVFFVLRRELLGSQPLQSIQESTEYHPVEDTPADIPTTFSQRLRTIDAGGQLLFLIGFTLLILALTWGGGDYAWATPHVLAPLVLGLMLVLLFFWWEFLLASGRMLARTWPATRAMIPWALVVERDVSLLVYVQFGVGMSMNAVLYFCSLYFTWVLGKRANEAGKQLLYYIPGLGGGVYLGFLLFKVFVKRSWPVMFLGAVLQAVGVGVLGLGLHREHMPTIAAMMVLVGVGNGMRFFIAPIHGIALFRHSIAAIVSILAVAAPLGGTLGITLMSTILNNKTSNLTQEFGNITEVSHTNNSMDMLAVRDSVKSGIVWAFIALVPFMALDVLGTLMMGNVTLVGGDEHVVERGFYLLSFGKRGGKGEDKDVGHGSRV